MIICLTGSEGKIVTEVQSGSGVGKDEVAKILFQDYGFIHLKFASSLRNFVYEKYGFDKNFMGDKAYEYNEKIRLGSYPYYYSIQDLLIISSEVEREKDPYIWIRGVVEEIRKEPRIHYVISDLRQWNEASVLKLIFDAEIWEVVRSNPSKPRQKLDCKLIGLENRLIYNNGNLQDLKQEIRRDTSFLLRGRPCALTISRRFQLWDSQPWLSDQ